MRLFPLFFLKKKIPFNTWPYLIHLPLPVHLESGTCFALQLRGVGVCVCARHTQEESQRAYGRYEKVCKIPTGSKKGRTGRNLGRALRPNLGFRAFFVPIFSVLGLCGWKGKAPSHGTARSLPCLSRPRPPAAVNPQKWVWRRLPPESGQPDYEGLAMARPGRESTVPGENRANAELRGGGGCCHTRACGARRRNRRGQQRAGAPSPRSPRLGAGPRPRPPPSRPIWYGPAGGAGPRTPFPQCSGACRRRRCRLRYR